MYVSMYPCMDMALKSTNTADSMGNNNKEQTTYNNTMLHFFSFVEFREVLVAGSLYLNNIFVCIDLIFLSLA